MYLTASLDISDISQSKQDELKTIFPEVEIESIRAKIGDWCKVYPIHKWFVLNVQGGCDNCALYDICKDDINKLLVLVNNVIDKKQKPEEALPFPKIFFNVLSYDEYYFEDLIHTKKILERALKLYESGWNIQYQSSW